MTQKTLVSALALVLIGSSSLWAGSPEAAAADSSPANTEPSVASRPLPLGPKELDTFLKAQIGDARFEELRLEAENLRIYEEEQRIKRNQAEDALRKETMFGGGYNRLRKFY